MKLYTKCFGVLAVFLNLAIVCWTEWVIDECRRIPGTGYRLGNVLTLSSNLTTDTANPENYNGDDTRFKREVSGAGHISYLSHRRFQQVEVIGYVFDPNVNRTWSVVVNMGSKLEAGEGSRSNLVRITEQNIDKYKIKGGKNKWMRFKVSLRTKSACPRRINVILNGSASNNEYPGWGVQLATIRLDESWYEGCSASCEIQEDPCKLDNSLTEKIDYANDFSMLKSKSSNIQLDDADAEQHFNGDTSRFKRSNKHPAELVYRSSKGIRKVTVEYFVYSPYTARMTLFPYMSQDCQPICLHPERKKGSQPETNGWRHFKAEFDLRNLPYCPTHASIHIFGGSRGWDLQISSVTLVFLGDLDEKSRHVSRDVSRPTSTRSTEGTSSGSPSGWWIWLLVLFGAVIVFVGAGFTIHMLRACLGDDDRHVYHISNWLPYQKKNTERPSTMNLTPAVPEAKRTIQMMQTEHNSFTFAPSKAKP